MNSIHRRFLIIAGLIAAGNGHAFELLHVDYGHSYFFVFNGGSDSGVREGMTACVDDDEGWELFCGKVVRVKTTVAAVEAPDNMEAWLEPGQRVRIEEMGAPKGRKRSENDETESDEEGQLEKPIDFSQRPITWPASYVATPVLPYQVQHPDFAVDTRINGSGSIWSGDSSTKRSLMGVSVGRRAPWSHTLDHEIDVTWRYIGPTKKEVDYDPNSANVYAVEQSKITDLGFSWNFLSPTLGEGLQWGWLGGLGFQYLTYAYNSSVVDDDGGSQGGDLAASQARMLALTGRGGLRLEQIWRQSNAGPSASPRAAAGVSLVGLLPLYARTTWSHGTHTMPVDVPEGDQSSSQFEEAADLKKTRYGLETSVYASWMF